MSEFKPKTSMRVEGLSNNLWNADLALLPHQERTWSTPAYVALWVAQSVCIPTYLLASGLIVLGMDWQQALGTILLGSGIVLALIMLNAHAGAKYGISFAVVLRASFGVLGAAVPATVQALVSAGWFGINCWIGAQAIFAAIRLMLPSTSPNLIWLCFAASWCLNVGAMWRFADSSHSKQAAAIRLLQAVSIPLLLIVGLALLYSKAGNTGGLGTMLANTAGPPHIGPVSDFRKIFLPSLSATIGFWAAMALRIPDLARYAKSQKVQMKGDAIGLPLSMTLFSFLAIAVTSATMLVTPDHKPVWDLMQLIAAIHQPATALAGLAVILLATLSTNLTASLGVPSNNFRDLCPGFISLPMGILMTGILGIALMPWELLADSARYINGWLICCSGLLAPIAGVMIADYFIVHKRSLNVDELHVRGGMYEYMGGFNPKALTALASGVALALVGLFVPVFQRLYDCAWFVGFVTSAALYLALMTGPDMAAMIPPNPLLIPVDSFKAEPTA